MAVGGNDRSANRNYPLPTPGNWLSEDMARLITALEAIDVDVAGLLTAVAARALLIHSHTIGQVTGLQDALDGKQNVGAVAMALDDLTDVNVTGAAALQVLMKSAGSGWVAGIVDAANLSGWTAKLAASVIDAAQITSGTLDPARIPVLASNKTIIASGAIADLTSPQQSQISTGTHVTTTDGRRWVYTGSGSKTAEASYIELGDVTPEWAVIANKPGLLTSFAALTIAAGDLIYGTGAGTLGRMAIADGFLKSSGGVLSWSSPPSGNLVNIQVFWSSGTYTPTAGATRAKVTVVGGGGGGGGSNTAAGAGGGGGSGSAGIGFITSLSSTSVTVGAGGAGGAAGANGSNGGASSFGSLIVCPGGGPGIFASGANAPAGGAWASAAPTGSGLTYGFSGNAGETGLSLAVANRYGGNGAGSIFGGAGGGFVNGGAGQNGSGSGAGGGGASGASFSGGAGAPGVVIIEEYR